MSKSGQKGEQFYLAAIGDLKRSRKDRDRARTQKRLERAIESVNHEFEGKLGARFVITLGDEFQGLLSIPGDAKQIIDRINRNIEDIPIRYGLGWGSLSTELKNGSLGMDGTCFHNARAALLRAKDENRGIVVNGFGEHPDLALNGVLALIGGVRQRWKPVQKETVELMSGMRLQKEVAELRGVSKSVISETLKSALYRQITDAESALEVLLNHFAKLKESDQGRENP